MAKNKKNKTDKGKGKPGLVGKHGYRKPEEIKTHPELKELYLRISEDEEPLSEGIKSGFLEDRPVTLVKGPWTNGEEVIADGHTRTDLAIKDGVQKIPVVVHETETLLDAVALVFGIDFRQRKRHEPIHLIHLLEKFQPMVSSISDAGKKPKGKLSALLGRWIGMSQATVERLQSILKNPEAKAYVQEHNDEKLSILNIYEMFKDKAEGGDGPSAPRGKGQETPPVPPAPPAGQGEGPTEKALDFPDAVRLELLPMDTEGCPGFGNHPILEPNAIGAKCECSNNELCKTVSQAWARAEEEQSAEGEYVPKCRMFGRYDETCISDCGEMALCKAKMGVEADPKTEQPAPPEEDEELECFYDYPLSTVDGLTCDDCKDKLACMGETHVSLLDDVAGLESKIAEAEAEGDEEKVKQYQEFLEPYPLRIEKLLADMAAAGMPSPAPSVNVVTSPDDQQVDSPEQANVLEEESREEIVFGYLKELPLEMLDRLAGTPAEEIRMIQVITTDGECDTIQNPNIEQDEQRDMKMVVVQFAEMVERLPEWIANFLVNLGPEEIKAAQWVMAGEGPAPEEGEGRILAKNPDNPPLKKEGKKKKTAADKKAKEIAAKAYGSEEEVSKKRVKAAKEEVKKGNGKKKPNKKSTQTVLADLGNVIDGIVTGATA